MSQSELNEKTLLISGTPKPIYAFESSIARQRKRKVRQFQCCICAIFLSIMVVAIVVSVAYSVNQLSPETNSTESTDEINLVALFSSSYLIKDPFNVSSSDYKEAIDMGKKALHNRENIERMTPELNKDSASYKHQKLVATTAKGREISKLGYIEGEASKYINRNTSKFSKIKCFNGTVDPLFKEVCSNVSQRCNIYSKFRSFNGSCNNMKNPNSFGVGYQTFRRILPPDYSDGISKPRIAKSGAPLPSARTISNTVHRPSYHEDPKFTVMLAVYGQFLDHDITATALTKGTNGNSISCCDRNVVHQHPECFPVNLDKDDSYYNEYNVTCMEFVRSAAAPTCCFGSREQFNQVSAFIDGSMIYGSDEELSALLRSFEGGQLKMFLTDDNRTLLPASEDPFDGCNRYEEAKEGRYCFMTGDSRANENLHLTSMHLLWARNHNYVASKLSELNDHWDDERIYQESRRIVGAQLQHITYDEFLPILLGDYMKKFDLNSSKHGYFNGYNKSLDATVGNGFAASAFRFAHTLIPTLIKMIGNDTSSANFVQLHEMLFNPFKLYSKGKLDSAIRGAMNTQLQASDPHFSPELKDRMFESQKTDTINKSRKICGLDLVSLNIQRGRDHGLPGYTTWREHCGLKRPRTFADLAGDIDDDLIRTMKSVYRHVDDIDFYTGALSEKPIKNSFLGPTITCILLEQFIRLKKGDRFWYENPIKPQAFTPEQLQEIRKTSLAYIICKNSDDVRNTQPLVMQRSDKNNRLTSCKNIPSPDLNQWKESLHHVDINKDEVSVKTMG